MLMDGKQKIAHYLVLFVHQHLLISPLLFVSPETAPPIRKVWATGPPFKQHCLKLEGIIIPKKVKKSLLSLIHLNYFHKLTFRSREDLVNFLMLWLSETSVVERMGDQENNTGIYHCFLLVYELLTNAQGCIHWKMCDTLHRLQIINVTTT